MPVPPLLIVLILFWKSMAWSLGGELDLILGAASFSASFCWAFSAAFARFLTYLRCARNALHTGLCTTQSAFWHSRLQYLANLHLLHTCMSLPDAPHRLQ